MQTKELQNGRLAMLAAAGFPDGEEINVAGYGHVGDANLHDATHPSPLRNRPRPSPSPRNR